MTTWRPQENARTNGQKNPADEQLDPKNILLKGGHL